MNPGTAVRAPRASCPSPRGSPSSATSRRLSRRLARADGGRRAGRDLGRTRRRVPARAGRRRAAASPGRGPNLLGPRRSRPNAAVSRAYRRGPASGSIGGRQSPTRRNRSPGGPASSECRTRDVLWSAQALDPDRGGPGPRSRRASLGSRSRTGRRCRSRRAPAPPEEVARGWSCLACAWEPSARLERDPSRSTPRPSGRSGGAGEQRQHFRAAARPTRPTSPPRYRTTRPHPCATRCSPGRQRPNPSSRNVSSKDAESPGQAGGRTLVRAGRLGRLRPGQFRLGAALPEGRRRRARIRLRPSAGIGRRPEPATPGGA